jgi:DNA segregation ATPase FtsK/SpoIIIE-like protein
MDKDTRRIYEAILYEPLRRMIQAVSDPDYNYIINDNENFVDKNELYDFWTKTMIAEIQDFNVSEKKRELVQKRLKKIRDASIASITPKVLRNFKEYTEQFIPYDLTNKNMTNQEKIEHILRSFGIIAKVQHVFDGYSSSSYLLELNAGTPIATINRYRLDIANALNVPNVRIQKDLFVYDGKSYLAIESAKKSTDTLAWDKEKLKENKIPLGLDNFQNVVYWDLDNHSTPHMLICGATGSGKSVSIRSTIEYALLAGINEIYIFDPKYEFVRYARTPGITVVNEIEYIEERMKLLVDEMQERVKSGEEKRTLVVFDEFADAVANSRKGKELDITEEVQVGYYAPKKLKGIFGYQMSEPIPKMEMRVTGRLNSLEENLRIILQKGRSSGFRVIAATQRASTKIITGDAKVNFPVQVCFRVPKDIDSQVVIDEPGAEALNGRGDGLIKSPEYLNVVRFQAFYHE